MDWTAESFLKSDLHFSGDAWRYELVDGVVVARAAPASLNGVIAVNVAAALKSRMKGHPCRVEFATGAVPHEVPKAIGCSSRSMTWKAC